MLRHMNRMHFIWNVFILPWFVMGIPQFCTLQAVTPCFLLHAVSQCGEWKITVTILLFVVDYVS
jgi:hypothetical protein